MDANVETILWTYNEKSDKTFAVKTRVMWKGQSRYYKVKMNGRAVSLSQLAWVEVNDANLKLRGEKKATREAIISQEARAKDAIVNCTANGQRPFSFLRFEEVFTPGKNQKANFFQVFDKFLLSLLKEGRIKTHNTYMNSRRAFYKFCGCKDIRGVWID